MSWAPNLLGFTASSQALPYVQETVHGIAKVVLTFRGARALPEVAVKVLGFKG